MNQKKPTLLTVGPLPPPMTGTPVSFQVFVDQARASGLLEELVVVDASPKHLKQASGTGLRLNSSNFSQAWRIVKPFVSSVKKADHVLLFGSNTFVITLAPLLLAISKATGTPCSLRTFGGSLDQYVTNLPAPLKMLAMKTLKGMKRVIVETDLLYRHFEPLLGSERVRMVAGYRQLPETELASAVPTDSDQLRLAFFGIVKEDKGVFDLLEAVRLLDPSIDVQIDMYGSIKEEAAERFAAELPELDNVAHHGVLEWDQVIDTLMTYDALVHPTYYAWEGQPGVLIEAMMAGVPAITTNFRALPELVEDGVNGLLVEPQNPRALATAIERAALERTRLKKMGQANADRRAMYDAATLVPSIITHLED